MTNAGTGIPNVRRDLPGGIRAQGAENAGLLYRREGLAGIKW